VVQAKLECPSRGLSFPKSQCRRSVEPPTRTRSWVVTRFSRSPVVGASGKLGCGVVAEKVKLVVDPDFSAVFANPLVKTHTPMAGLIVWAHAPFATAAPNKLTAEKAITCESSNIAATTAASIAATRRPCDRRPFSKPATRQGLMNQTTLALAAR
jgi:hypothetical protein